MTEIIDNYKIPGHKPSSPVPTAYVGNGNGTTSTSGKGMMCGTRSTGDSLTVSVSQEEEKSWATSKIIDEFITTLARAHTYVVNKEFGHTLIVSKYYEKAEYQLFRIPLHRPIPTFDIELSDLTLKLKRELSELMLLDPPMFWYVTKMAVTCIFENIHFDYFHRSVMRHLKIRFVK